ncbi:RNA 2',3'-cyclic phosphodiesterase [Desulfogranum marinum]|uniref:RNA 2',3'-cyclic phosphodiesterase n=1 Tax=Desulfogranum marinum TaxID=453220 RepID=UPI001964EA00|nr:RNA 2',3'-cyclic phosphodiesterase [Desulfogranum marinum]MBM9512319.1 RNA 2',3'-cyclic phosphodiesterase [Desulfogranum marinum]
MKKRLFVALDLPESITARIESLCSGLPSARWITPEQLHLTLCFIGEVEGAAFHDIREELSHVITEPFSMRLDGMGFFPPRGKPRVVWVGVEKNEQLHLLHQKIYTCLTRAGVKLEKRKFAPHITIARLKNTPVSKVARYLEEYGLFCTEPFEVNNFRLYSSMLGRQGAVHNIEQEYGLL